MNLHKLLLALSVIALASVGACSTPTEVTTKDGQTITTPDTPDMDKDGFVSYEKDGKEVKVNRDEVRRIEEVK